MWLKTLGLILVIASCSGIGAEAVHRLRERLRLLETLRRMASHMKGEILYANVPLAEALYRTGKRNKGAAGELFIAIATELEQETGESFEAVWRAKAGKFAAGSVLNKKEQEQLEQILDTLKDSDTPAAFKRRGEMEAMLAWNKEAQDEMLGTDTEA